jgi:hypothetical protein
MTIAATDEDITEALADQLSVIFDSFLFGRRSRVILRLTLRRLEERYGRRAVRAALRLRHRLDRESYRAERQRQASV